MSVIGLTVDPVDAAAIAAGRLRRLAWPAGWSQRLTRLGVEHDAGRPSGGVPVLIHGALGWTPARAQRAADLGVDRSAAGRVVARAVLDRWVGDGVELDLVEPIEPVEEVGDATTPWMASPALLRRIRAVDGTAAPAAEDPPALRAPSAPAADADGPERVWCERCWRLVGVKLGERVVVFPGVGLAASGSSCVAHVVCGSACAGAHHVADVFERGPILPVGAEMLRRGLLDTMLGGAISLGAREHVDLARAAVPVIDGGLEGIIPTDMRPPDEHVGRVVVLRREGRLAALARLAGRFEGEQVVGQRPRWWARPAFARGWILDDVVRLPQAVRWGRGEVRGDELRAIVEQVRAGVVHLGRWLRFGDEELRAEHVAGHLGTSVDVACAVAAATLANDRPRWGDVRAEWAGATRRLVSGGRSIPLPDPARSWLACRRAVLRRSKWAPAPYPVGPAPAGRYLAIGSEGVELVEHAGGEAQLVWLARADDAVAQAVAVALGGARWPR